MKNINLLLLILTAFVLFGCEKNNQVTNSTPQGEGGKIHNVSTIGQFESEVLESDKPVLVKFHAEWCGACKILTPRINELSSEYEGRVKFVTVDVDSAAALAKQYGIRSLPTVFIFNEGKEAGKIIGAGNLASYREKLNSVIGK